MASAEHEPIMAVWGQKPPEAESILVIACPTEPANLALVCENSMFCYGPLVSELGGQSAWCPPNPVIGGPVPLSSTAYAFLAGEQYIASRYSSPALGKCLSCSSRIATVSYPCPFPCNAVSF